MPANVENRGETAYVVLSGNFDFSRQGELADAFDQAVNTADAKEVRVDMTDVTFIDSSVIRALLKLHDRASASGKLFSIWNCNEQIREIFVIGGFDQIFVIR